MASNDTKYRADIDRNTGRTVDRERDIVTDRSNPDANRDPITGAPGSHPVGTGLGAAGAGAAGAAIGAALSGPFAPAGAVVGAVVGALAGGLAGKGVAEAVNPTDEGEYWRENYRSRPYANEDYTYEDFAPAYQYGWESTTRHEGRRFEEAEPDLQRGWQQFKGTSRLNWEKARHATRDAWDRVKTPEVRRESPSYAEDFHNAGDFSSTGSYGGSAGMTVVQADNKS